MPKTKELVIGYSRTVNLGNYESAKFEVSLTRVIEDADDVNEVANTTMGQAKSFIHNHIIQYKKERKEGKSV